MIISTHKADGNVFIGDLDLMMALGEKSGEVKVNRVQPLQNMDICIKVNCNPFNNCQDTWWYYIKYQGIAWTKFCASWR